ncbi:MAG: molybdopterin-dependent oxidoreductase [Bacteroidetes bacterium]|nr:molybdopterin-dependent oxidoreductase [Bacteroidota bacterium]
MEPQTHHTFCRICESLCGLEVDVKDNKVVAIRPDAEHVATRGFGCPKGLKQHHLFSSPDRLQYPMKRVGKTWKRVSWEDALGGIGEKVRQIRGDHHPDAVAMYVGTAAGFGVLHPVFAQGFMTAVGSKSMYASATQDCSNKFAAARHIYGFPFTQPFPDLHHTECLIIVGANPVVSKWSFLQVPNPVAHLKEMVARGSKVYVVDPRKTETAKTAGEHVFIKPGTDVYFFLSFLHELIAQNGVNRDRALRYMNGLDEALALAQPWPAERTAELTGINPEVLRQMVRHYAGANGAALYSSTGVNMGGQGTLAFYLQEVINAVSGNLDRRGGTLVGMGVIDFAKFGAKNGVLLRDDRSRIGDFGSTNDAFPGGVLADEILTPGPKQVRALFVTGGNPLITMANSNRLRKAFQELELLVTLDILPNETGSLAHYMLPCTAPLERPDLPFIFPLMLGLQAKPYLQATKRVLRPQGEQRDEATIYLDLCRASGVNLFGSAVAQRFFESARGVHRLRQKIRGEGQEQPSVPQEFLLNGLLRLTGQPGFGKLLKHRHGWLRPDHEVGSFLGVAQEGEEVAGSTEGAPSAKRANGGTKGAPKSRVTTPDGKINLAPEVLAQAVRNLDQHAQALQRQDHERPFRLISKRHVTTHNSWTHNYEGFVEGSRATNYLYVHPNDLARIGVQDGDLVDVSSQTGTVRLNLKTLADLMPGVVALPHGWGHQSTQLSVARQTRGVNVNILAADGPEGVDPLSGMVHLTGIPVSVRPAAGPQAHSWSGLLEDVLEV